MTNETDGNGLNNIGNRVYDRNEEYAEKCRKEAEAVSRLRTIKMYLAYRAKR